MKVFWVLIWFLISSVVSQSSISFGGYLEDLGNFLTTSYHVDTNTYLIGVLTGGVLMLQAPLIVLYKIIAEVVSIVALSLFINFLGERMGFGSIIPFFQNSAISPRDDTIYESVYEIPNQTDSIRTYVDKTYLVHLEPGGYEYKNIRKSFAGANNPTAGDRRTNRNLNSRRRNAKSVPEIWGPNSSPGVNKRNGESDNKDKLDNVHYSWEKGDTGNYSTSTSGNEQINDRLKVLIADKNARVPSTEFVAEKNNKKNNFFGNYISNYITQITNGFVKNKMKDLVDKVLESDTAKAVKRTLAQNISNFILKSIDGIKNKRTEKES